MGSGVALVSKEGDALASPGRRCPSYAFRPVFGRQRRHLLAGREIVGCEAVRPQSPRIQRDAGRQAKDGAQADLHDEDRPRNDAVECCGENGRGDSAADQTHYPLPTTHGPQLEALGLVLEAVGFGYWVLGSEAP